jgi:hypothetical protein
VLRAYEAEGWISQSYRCIAIRDAAALQACCSMTADR